jgi:hypothetical protein
VPQALKAWPQALATHHDMQHPSAGQVRGKLATMQGQPPGN